MGLNHKFFSSLGEAVIFEDGLYQRGFEAVIMDDGMNYVVTW